MIPMSLHASVNSHCPINAVFNPLGDTRAKEDYTVHI